MQPMWPRRQPEAPVQGLYLASARAAHRPPCTFSGVWQRMSDNVISYIEMRRRDGASLQQPMHVGLGRNQSVIRMLLRPNAPYRERVEAGGSTLLRSVGRSIAARLQCRANRRFAMGPRRTAFEFVIAFFALCAFQTQSDAASLRVGFLSPSTPEKLRSCACRLEARIARERVRGRYGCRHRIPVRQRSIRMASGSGPRTRRFAGRCAGHLCHAGIHRSEGQYEGHSHCHARRFRSGWLWARLDPRAPWWKRHRHGGHVLGVLRASGSSC